MLSDPTNQLASERRRLGIDQSVAGFSSTRDLSELGQNGLGRVFSICASSKATTQFPLFREDQLSQEIVREHWDCEDPPDIRIYAGSGYVIGGGGLLVKGHQLWLPPDCYPPYLGSMCNQAEGLLPSIWAGALGITNPVVKRCEGVYACPLHPNLVYGHFLLEMLPKLYLLRVLRDMGAEFKVAVPHALPEWARLFLNLYFDETELVLYDVARDVLFPRAVLCPGMMHKNYNFHPLMNVVLEDVRLRALRSDMSLGRHYGQAKYVYLSRTRAAGGWHIMTNELEVEDIFRDAGFVIVHPQELTWAEQLMVYRGADCLAGEYSSALHNALFARRGVKVLSLNRINWYQSQIARLRGQRLGFVPPADGLMRDWRQRGDTPVAYHIDCARLKGCVAKFLEWDCT